MIRIVPRFPKNVGTLVSFVRGGVHCPRRIHGGNVRKEITIDIIVSRGNHIASPIVVHDECPTLSRRTLQVMRLVPR